MCGLRRCSQFLTSIFTGFIEQYIRWTKRPLVKDLMEQFYYLANVLVDKHFLTLKNSYILSYRRYEVPGYRATMCLGGTLPLLTNTPLPLRPGSLLAWRSSVNPKTFIITFSAIVTTDLRSPLNLSAERTELRA